MALLPPIVLGPFIGPYIDRWNRRWTMIVADLSISLMTVVLVVLFLTGAVQVWHIFVAIIARSVGQSFHFPAMLASMPMIVPEDQLTRASGLNQTLQGIISIAAPPAGAFMLGILPMQAVLAVDIVTAVIAVGCLLFISIPQPASAASAIKTSAWADMLTGFRYVWSWKGLVILIVISALLSMFIVPAYTLLPFMVTTHLEGDVLKLGWLESAYGVGVIAGGLILGVWGGFKRKIITSLMGLIVTGIATIGLGFTSIPLFMLGVTASFLVGVGLTFANGPIMAVLNALVAKNMQGRVFSLIGSISSAMTPLGMLLAGPGADAFGIRPIYFVAGAAVLIIALSGPFIPALMNLEKGNATKS
jgi:MFS transporter, DHA3 family, macrolide efflux protein